jgi:hypothetical protein
MLVGDLVFGLQTLDETYVDGGWLDGAWLLAYLIFATLPSSDDGRGLRAAPSRRRPAGPPA